MTAAPQGPGLSTTVESLRLCQWRLGPGQAMGWKIAVTGTAKARGYQMSFDTETPADIVAAAVARVLGTQQL